MVKIKYAHSYSLLIFAFTHFTLGLFYDSLHHSGSHAYRKV